jgi:thiol-disulfide isomerase/thioredoxin
MNVDNPVVYNLISHQISGSTVSGSLELTLQTKSLPKTSMILNLALLEDVSTATSFSGEPLTNVVLARKRIDLTGANMAEPIEFSITDDKALPDDLSLVAFLQTTPESFANDAIIHSGLHYPLSQRSKKMNKIVLLIAMLLFAAFIMADAMPDFRLPDLNGKNVSLEDLLGKGPVMMDFWADYCKPCKDAMPVLNGLAEKYDSLTIVMVSIDAPKNQSKAKTYLKSKNYKFVNLFDCEKALAKKLGWEPLRTPSLWTKTAR